MILLGRRTVLVRCILLGHAQVLIIVEAVSSKSSGGHRCDAGGSPPPPPPPPTGSGVDDDESDSTPSTIGPLTYLVLVSYLLGKRALETRRLKDFGLSLSDSSSSSTLVTASDSTLDLGSSVLGSVNASSPLIVEVQPTWDSFDDESAQLVSTSIASALEIAISSSLPPATVDFWDAYGTQKIPVALYQPPPSSPNVLLLHETTTCSVDDNPTPDTISVLLPLVKALYTLFIISFCGAAAFLASFISFTEFARETNMDSSDITPL
jgi:hypothetical protein